jgi:ATP-dependent DNA helicase RecG
MRDLFERLIKVLRLEQSKKFADSAVIGGLEGFLAFWLSEARAQAGSPAERARVEEVANRLQGYGSMEPGQRGAQVRYLTERLAFQEEATPSVTPPTVGADTLPPALESRHTNATVPVEETAAAPVVSPTPPEAQAAEAARRQAPPRQDEPRDRQEETPPQEQRSRRASRSADEMLQMDQALDRPVTDVPGVGSAKAERLARMGIRSIRDLLYHAPFRYEDYTAMKQIADLMYGDEVTIAGVVQEIDQYKSQQGTIVVTARVSDGTGVIGARWFGNRYLVTQLRPGTMVRLSGKVDAHLGRLQLNSPRHDIVDEREVRSGWLVPIYSRTEGVGEKALIRDIGAALEHTAGRIPDPLPETIRNRFSLLPLQKALRWLHQAHNADNAQAARRRLAFDELLRLQLGMLQQRREWRAQPGHRVAYNPTVLERFYETLPFPLTGAQHRAIEEILDDMRQEWAMNRLLQGDVGSGKTVVAAAALLAAVSAGFQGSLMAPTGILAEQHFKGLASLLNPQGTPLLGERPVRVALLTGAMPAADKQAIREQIAAGEVDVIIGTHALIQEEVEFARLGLAIVDEQHRFGVRQRGALRERTPDGMPDVLVMSATPIPRSLALTLYGDLDLSIIDEMPPGREPIITRAITPHQRARAYTYIRRQVLEGRQAFVICPLVEQSDKLEARAAVDEHHFLQQEIFPEFKVGLLHGRMRQEEKEAEMARFYRNESQILVSTSVVEVGIDVPNATVMLVEGANRFGLAQLHQFRGRVGRGAARSLCLLMAEETLSSEGEQRLNALVQNSDGFALAEEDLKMRGPGDFFGTRQSGLPELKLAKLGDSTSLVRAREAARLILDDDPALAQPQHALLKEQTRRYWANRQGDLS